MGSKVPLDDSASNSDEALFDDIISLVMSSVEQFVMMSSHCVYLSYLHYHLETYIPHYSLSENVILCYSVSSKDLQVRVHQEQQEFQDYLERAAYHMPETYEYIHPSADQFMKV